MKSCSFSSGRKLAALSSSINISAQSRYAPSPWTRRAVQTTKIPPTTAAKPSARLGKRSIRKAASPSAVMPTSIAVAGGLTALDDAASSTIACPGAITARPSAAEALLRSSVGARCGGFHIWLGAERHPRFVGEFAGADSVGFEHRFQQRRRRERAQQLDIWNHAVAADEAGEVFRARQEIHFLEEVERFYVVGIDLI